MLVLNSSRALAAFITFPIRVHCLEEQEYLFSTRRIARDFFFQLLARRGSFVRRWLKLLATFCLSYKFSSFWGRGIVVAIKSARSVCSFLLLRSPCCSEEGLGALSVPAFRLFTTEPGFPLVCAYSFASLLMSETAAQVVERLVQ